MQVSEIGCGTITVDGQVIRGVTHATVEIDPSAAFTKVVLTIIGSFEGEFVVYENMVEKVASTPVASADPQ